MVATPPAPPPADATAIIIIMTVSIIQMADLLAKRDLETQANDWTFDDFIRMATAASSKENV
jgi:hypothetical protein